MRTKFQEFPSEFGCSITLRCTKTLVEQADRRDAFTHPFFCQQPQKQRSPITKVLLPVLRLLLVHPLFSLLKEADGSLGFLHKAVDVDFKVLVLTELRESLVLLIFAQYKAQMLVGIR